MTKPTTTWTKRRGEPDTIDGQPGNWVIKVRRTASGYADGTLFGRDGARLVYGGQNIPDTKRRVERILREEKRKADK